MILNALLYVAEADFLKNKKLNCRSVLMKCMNILS